MTNVVSLRGDPIPDPDKKDSPEPNADAIEMVEKILEMVKAGEIQSIAVVGVRNGEVFNHFDYLSCEKFLMCSAAALLQHRIAERIWS